MLKRRREPSRYTKKFGPKARVRKSLSLNLQPLTILAMLALAIFLAGGGLYFFFEPSLVAIGFQGRIYPLIPHEIAFQTLSESLLAIIFLAAGVGGCYLSLSGLHSKLGYRPSMVKVVVGMILLVTAAATMFFLSMVKF